MEIWENTRNTWKILGELCMRMAWNVEATPIPIMPSKECRWSAFIVVLSSSEVFSNDEFSIMTKHLQTQSFHIIHQENQRYKNHSYIVFNNLFFHASKLQLNFPLLKGNIHVHRLKFKCEKWKNIKRSVEK